MMPWPKRIEFPSTGCWLVGWLVWNSEIQDSVVVDIVVVVISVGGSEEVLGERTLDFLALGTWHWDLSLVHTPSRAVGVPSCWPFWPLARIPIFALVGTEYPHGSKRTNGI